MDDDTTPAENSVGETRPWRDFKAGAKAISPLLPAGVAVGLVTGVAAAAIGLTHFQAVGMAVLVYSPSVMLTAFQLLESETPTLILVGASLIVGVRFMMLSLSIASYLDRLSTPWKWFLAYFLWTPIYAMSIERFESRPATSRRGYYLGLATPTWAAFVFTVPVGYLFSTQVPATWQLEFVVPLAFIALVMQMVPDRPTQAAAVTAGVAAVFGSTLPLNLGIVVATIAGAGAGVVVSHWEGD